MSTNSQLTIHSPYNLACELKDDLVNLFNGLKRYGKFMSFVSGIPEAQEMFEILDINIKFESYDSPNEQSNSKSNAVMCNTQSTILYKTPILSKANLNTLDNLPIKKILQKHSSVNSLQSLSESDQRDERDERDEHDSSKPHNMKTDAKRIYRIDLDTSYDNDESEYELIEDGNIKVNGQKQIFIYPNQNLVSYKIPARLEHINTQTTVCDKLYYTYNYCKFRLVGENSFW